MRHDDSAMPDPRQLYDGDHATIFCAYRLEPPDRLPVGLLEEFHQRRLDEGLRTRDLGGHNGRYLLTGDGRLATLDVQHTDPAGTPTLRDVAHQGRVTANLLVFAGNEGRVTGTGSDLRVVDRRWHGQAYVAVYTLTFRDGHLHRVDSASAFELSDVLGWGELHG